MTYTPNPPITDLYPGPDGVYQATQALARPTPIPHDPRQPVNAGQSWPSRLPLPQQHAPSSGWNFGHILIAAMVMFALLAVVMTVAVLLVNWQLGIVAGGVVIGIPLVAWLRRA